MHFLPVCCCALWRVTNKIYTHARTVTTATKWITHCMQKQAVLKANHAPQIEKHAHLNTHVQSARCRRTPCKPHTNMQHAHLHTHAQTSALTCTCSHPFYTRTVARPCLLMHSHSHSHCVALRHNEEQIALALACSHCDTMPHAHTQSHNCTHTFTHSHTHTLQGETK